MPSYSNFLEARKAIIDAELSGSPLKEITVFYKSSNLVISKPRLSVFIDGSIEGQVQVLKPECSVTFSFP